ncbi:ABC transporter ATP-binding protein [Afipia sp. P52-10]|nr:ABC transporter ATP-binding protein [Afipia sp. P52-10]
MMSVAAAATALSTYLLKDVVNAAYQERNFNLILTLSLGIAAIFIVRGAATYGQSVILSKIANAILADNQRRLFAKLMRENVGFYSDRHSSEFLARMTIGASAIAQLLNMLITSVGRDLLTLIGLLVVMIVQDPVMALIGLLVAPPALLVLRKLIRRIRGLAGNQFTGQANIQETMLEALQGIRTVKAFTLEGAMQQRIDANIDAVQASANKMARVSHRSSPLMETLGGLAICLTLVYSGYRIVETGATPGQFLSFLAAFLLAYEPAKRLAKLNLDLNAALIGARKLLEIVDSPSSEPDDGDKPALRLRDARVEFCDVTFAYRPGETVLDHMNLVAEPGKVTALVGPSGGGKSTVLNLMLRLYEVAEGAILVDGQTIADVSRQSLRLQTAYVGQDVFLFRDTIRENIAFGRPGASQADIIAAATAACAHDFIMGFPQGYDTPVGEHGAQLSGGQRQRIAIARALVKNAPIILLDEATAALDSESERQVQEAIEHLCHGRTTLVIAHRLNTIMHADTIHVIENGRVVETGNHDDLLRRNGRYASFFRLQYRDSRPLALASGNG